VARADEVARGLVGYLRGALGAPALDLDGRPEPLGGGFDTEIHAFRLRGAPAGFERPLVLRVLRAHHDPAMVLREQATQNAVAAQGYPAPRVLLASADPAPLGAAFAIMERAPGVPLLSRVVGMGGVLADAQARLHALDPTPLRGTLPVLDHYLDTLGRRVEAASLRGLAPLVAWLRAHRPPPEGVVICHGDFHPENVLVDGRAVSGVLDWPNALLAEPAFDVAATLNILRYVPAGIALASPLRWLAAAGQRVLAAQYLARYRRRRPVAPGRLAYYEVATALRALVRAAAVLAGVPGAPPPGALDRSPYASRLLARAARITGLSPSLP
jgi:aminoglycoside phosphotransferase (APT) family kinase protein